MRLADFKVLTFDCYGTLIDWESGILAALADWRWGGGRELPDDTLLASFGRAESEAQARSPDLLYPKILEATLHEMGREFGIPVSEEAAQAFGASVPQWPAFPDSAESLARLKARYALGVLSNVDVASFIESARRLNVAWDLVVTAQEVGSYKPNPANFEILFGRLEMLEFRKDEVLHVAQSLFHDHVPAKAAGMRTVWIDRRAGKGGGATATPERAVEPDLTFPSMTAFLEAVAAEG